MQPETAVLLDPASFNRVKKNIIGLTSAVRGRRNSPDYGSPVPLDIGVELTTRCNLHCKHCFLWNEDGLYNNTKGFNHKELSFSIMEKVLHETSSQKSNLFFWGTEPLLYPYFDELCRVLEKDKRWTVICTNGILIDRKIEQLTNISDNLAIVISVDGLEAAHNEIRGRGTFEKVMNNIKKLQKARNDGSYRGLITIHTVLNEKLIPDLYEYCLFVESLGINSLYIGFPWYINSKTAVMMDNYVANCFDFLPVDFSDSKPRSWHSYCHKLDTSLIPILKDQIDKITSHTWKLWFRFQPALETHELQEFLSGSEKPAQARTECYAVSNRMDIRADGTVTSCQCYPELIVGDLSKESVQDIWHGEKINKVRRTIAKGLAPVCSKCILLYLNGR